MKLLPNSWEEISTQTIDSSQRLEKELVFVSLVCQNPSGNLGFLADPRCMNVALSREREGLVVVGNRPTLMKNDVWKEYLDYLEALDPCIITTDTKVWYNLELNQTINNDNYSKTKINTGEKIDF